MTGIEWVRSAMGSELRYRLFVDGKEAPWFISKSRFSRGPSREPYQLFGRGMDPSGCAAGFGWYPNLVTAKARALENTCIGAEEVAERSFGNVKFILGDRVTTKGTSGIFGRPHGRLVSMTTGNACRVHWDDQLDPQDHWLPLLMASSLPAKP